MPKDKFILLNPYIEGTFQRVYYDSTPLKAAKSAYKNLSSNFINSVKQFKFTLLKKTDDLDLKNLNNNLYHFDVHEKKSNNNSIQYRIKSFKGEIKNPNLFLKNIKGIQRKYNINKKGNGKKDIIDDDDDDDDLLELLEDEFYDYRHKYPKFNYMYYYLYSSFPYTYFPNLPNSFPVVISYDNGANMALVI